MTADQSAWIDRFAAHSDARTPFERRTRLRLTATIWIGCALLRAAAAFVLERAG